MRRLGDETEFTVYCHCQRQFWDFSKKFFICAHRTVYVQHRQLAARSGVQTYRV